MRLQQYINEAISNVDLLETSACLGINPSDELRKAVDEWVFYKEGIVDVKKTLKIIQKEIKNAGDWNPKGKKIITSYKIGSDKKKDIEFVTDICTLAKGMMIFIDEEGGIIKKPQFIHNRINDYYNLEKEVMGEIKGSKNNTADCIICSCSPEELFESIKKDMPKPSSDGKYVITGKNKYIQVSLKKGRDNAQLGKITSYLIKGIGVGVDIKTSINTILDSTQHLSDHMITEIWGADFIKRIGRISSEIWNNLKSAVSKVMLSLRKKLLSFSGSVSNTDLSNIANAIGYTGPLNEKTMSDKSEGFIKAIASNPNKVVDLINKKIDECEKISKNSEYIDSSVEKLKNVTIKNNDIPQEVFYLVSNYSTVSTIYNILNSAENISKTVRSMIGEMLFGGTKLPLWKVYGFYGVGKPYTFLGTIDHFIENMPNIRSECFGYSIKPTNDKHYTITICMLDTIIEEYKKYIFFRSGTNSSSRFTFIIEGTGEKLLPIEKSLKEILQGV